MGNQRHYRYTAACLPPTDNKVCTLGADGIARLATFPPGALLGSLDMPKGARGLQAEFFPLGDQIAVLGDRSVRLFDTATRRSLGDLEETNGRLRRTLTVSPNGKYIAASGDVGETSKVWLWDADTRALIRSLDGYSTSEIVSAFTHDGKRIATAPLREASIQLWNVATGEKIETLSIANTNVLAFSPDDQTLAAAAASEVCLWDVRARGQVAVLRGHQADIQSLAFAPDGKILATVDNSGIVRLWHVATRQESCILHRHSLPLRWVKFLSLRRLVVGSWPDPKSPTGATDLLVFDAGDPAGRVEPSPAPPASSEAARPWPAAKKVD
jgi:WD40 repeat protein